MEATGRGTQGPLQRRRESRDSTPQTLESLWSRAWPSASLPSPHLPTPPLFNKHLPKSTRLQRVPGWERLGPCPRGTLTPRGARNPTAAGGSSRSARRRSYYVPGSRAGGSPKRKLVLQSSLPASSWAPILFKDRGLRTWEGRLFNLKERSSSFRPQKCPVGHFL